VSYDDLCEVVITAPDAEWLATFTRELVDDRLCASGHNISQVRPIYRWHGTMHDDREARVALHTRRDLMPAIAERVNLHHPYEVPCVIALPLIGGSESYAQWIRDETQQQE
jgi:periplasmic divalent cation tolerance protein